jgi:hypothetical protein
MATKVQIIVGAIRTAGRDGILYADLCELLTGSWACNKSAVSEVTRTLLEARCIRQEDTAGHRNVRYYWIGPV